MYQNSWEILGALFHKQFIYIHRSQWVCEGVPLELICSELIYSERLFGPLIFGHAHIKRCWKQLVQSLCNLHSCKLTWLLEHPHVQYQYISSNGGFSVVMLVFGGYIPFQFGQVFWCEFPPHVFPFSIKWTMKHTTLHHQKRNLVWHTTFFRSHFCFNKSVVHPWNLRWNLNKSPNRKGKSSEPTTSIVSFQPLISHVYWSCYHVKPDVPTWPTPTFTRANSSVRSFGSFSV